MFLLCFLCYRIYQNVSLLGSLVYVKPFGFDVNGEFDIQLRRLPPKPVLISMCSKEEYKAFINIPIDYKSCETIKNFCNISNITQAQNGFVQFSGIIPTKDRYRALIAMCSNERSVYEINLSFKNQYTYLDIEKIPLLTTKPILLGLILISICYWIFNWVSNCAGTNSLHAYFSIAYIITGASTLIDMFYYDHFDKTDDYHFIVLLSGVFSFLKELMLVSGMLLVSKGFGIVHSNISATTMLVTVLTCAIVLGSVTIYEYIESSLWSMMAFLTFIISLYFLIMQLMDGIRDALLHIIAHLYVIFDAGIDPTSTPVWEKFQIYQNLSFIIFSYFSVITLADLIITIAESPIWILEFIRDCCNVGLLMASMYLFRIRPALARGYQTIGEEGEPARFTREQVESREMDEEQFRIKKQWDSSTVLPPQPIIIDSESSRTENPNAPPEEDVNNVMTP